MFKKMNNRLESMNVEIEHRHKGDYRVGKISKVRRTKIDVGVFIVYKKKVGGNRFVQARWKLLIK
jgi:hypothetical protein